MALLAINLSQKIYSKDITTNDITGFLSSLIGVASSFATLASIGLETTAIGIQVLSIARFTNLFSIGIWAAGYVISHHEELKEYAINSSEILKNQYQVAADKLNDLKLILEAKIGTNLYEAVGNDSSQLSDIFIHETDGNLTYNFEYLDPTDSLNLKENLEIEATELYEFLNGFNTEQQSDFLSTLIQRQNLNNSFDPFVPEVQIEEHITEAIPQYKYITIDMSDSNLELIHLTKDDLRKSDLYSHENFNGATFYKNASLPWLHAHSSFLESAGKFYFYNGHGINKGVAFPLFYDKTTNLPLGLPLDNRGNFVEQNALDVLENSPALFNDPGHAVNNMALQVRMMQHAAIHGAGIHAHNALNAVNHRLDGLRKLSLDEIIDTKKDMGSVLSDKLSNTTKISATSGNTLDGKYCFDYNHLDTSGFDPKYGKILVEICFNTNPFSTDFG